MSQISQSELCFEGDGEVRARLRAVDWSLSPLGDPDAWPAPLCTALGMVLDSAFPMFIAWGSGLGFLYNDAYARIMGDKHPAALGQSFQAIWAEIWADIAPIVDRALSGKSAYFEDLPLKVVRRGYPEQSYFTFSYSPLHGADGTVGGMYCTVIETTERVMGERRAAFELELSDALLALTTPEQVLETASRLLGEHLGVDRVVYGEVDAERGTFHIPFYFARPGLPDAGRQEFRLDAFGPAIGDALSRGEAVLVDDVRHDPRTAASIDAWEQDQIRSVLTMPLVKAGRLTAFLSLNRREPWRWTEQELAYTRSTAERTWAALETARAQTELRTERDRSQYIFDTIAEGFLLIDRDWRILQMNAEGQRMAGLAASEVIGHNHWELFPEARDSEAGRMYQRVMDTGQPGSAEYRHTRQDGTVVWSDVRGYPTQDGIVSFFRDITDRKLAEEKLREADRRKDEFLAMLAHELRNPLAPISAAAELLNLGRLDEERVRRSSTIIGRQVRHMISLVDDLLDVSRVTRGLVTLDRGPVSAHTIVDEAVEQVLPLVRARGQQLSVTVQDEAISVMGDKARLVQVLANVLGNAAKYTPDGRRIDVSATRRDGQLVLTVRDEGIGMEPELTARVFDLFTQAQRSSDRALGGLGLGLALVKHLVELHGGSVTCESAGPGQGSTFVIALPAVQPPPSQERRQAPRPQRARGALKLLVVDDNADAALTLGMLLEACGHEVLVEHDSRKALARAHAERPDACLLDIGLPDMDGNELARRLRAQPETADSVLIAVTGYGQEQDREQAFASGFRYHLVKPVDMDRLAQVLDEIVACANAPG
ncbi:PAS domain-containing protein [Massilia solisilvae]|uniref:histidine kinase n=1 Tax=Massilia solisilvae TaxID=1811225 RepID=A0ABT2BL06_9BURK|nr:ATP-binding protein [Massilia solisilvae]MCS0608760.1 PAS domain-containing protein [Massilia solisilvae]